MTHVSKADAMKEYYRLCDRLDVGSPSGVDTRAWMLEARQAAMHLSNIHVRECNGVIGADGFAKWDDADQAQADRESLAAANKALNAFSKLFDAETYARLVIEFQGDPRGPSIIVSVRDGAQRVLTLW